MGMEESHRLKLALARSTKANGAQHPDTIRLRGEFNAARIAEYVAKAVADAPPLTEDQRRVIIGVMRAGGAQ